MAAERIRQGSLDREANALNAASQGRFDDFGEQQDTRASELGQYFADQQIEAGTQNEAAGAAQIAAVAPTSSNLTVREEAKQRGQARDFTNQQGMALGNLRAFGDVLGTNSRLQARDAAQIGQIGGFKRGSAGVLPFELEDANQAGNGAKLFGDILGLGGSLALSKGLTGGGASAASSAASGLDPWAGMRSLTASRGGGLFNLYGG